MGEGIKKILLFVIFVMLLLPLVQHFHPIIESRPLKGVFNEASYTPFTIKGWLNGSYQEQKSAYINDRISFRADMIRLNCQVDYSLFHKLNTGMNILGKEHSIFEELYITSWNGTDNRNYDTMRAKMVKLKALQDTFAKMGKSLILVHAASKGFFYPELIPDKYKPATPVLTNYQACVGIADTLGINQVDFNSWFCMLKGSSKELLYTKQGSHWSIYGGMVAGDSLVKYIERLRGIKMPHPYWRDTVRTSRPRYTDDDIASTANLIWPMAKETFTYGTTVCDSSVDKVRPKAVYIGDSFTWSLVYNNIFDCINSKWEFWFYNNEVYRPGMQMIMMKDYDWQPSIDQADYIVLLYTAPALTYVGNGFIEKEYAHFFPGKNK